MSGSAMSKQPSVGPRSQARRYAVLALYQWQVTGEDPTAIRAQMLDDPEWLDALASTLRGGEDDEPVDPKLRLRFNQELFGELIKGVPARLAEIDAVLSQVLDRPITQVEPVELVVLRIGVFEILYSSSVPSRVAINEAVELSKLFGSHDAHRIVNGVLDRISKRRSAAAPREPDSVRDQ